MPDFQFQPYDNRDATRSLIDIIQHGSDVQANALRQGAAAQAQGLETVGQNTRRMFDSLGAIGEGTIGQIMQQQRDAPRRAMEKLQLAAAQRQDQAAKDELLAEQSLRARLADTTKPPPTSREIAQLPGFNTERAAHLMGGLHDLSKYDLENEATTIAHMGSDIRMAMAAPAGMRQELWTGVKQRWEGSGLPPQLFPEQYNDQIASALLAKLHVAQADYTLKEGEQRISGSTNQPIATGGPQKPKNEAELALDAADPASATRAQSASALAAMKATGPKGIQKVAIQSPFDGKSAIWASMDPDTGRIWVTDPKSGADVTVPNAKQVTPPSIIINNEKKATTAAGALTPEGLTYAATQYRLTGQMPAVGRGDGTTRNSIVNEAAAQTKSLGLTPVMALQKQAARKADSAALTNMTKMSAAAESFETKALAQADIVQSLSDKVSRTQYPILNEALLKGAQRIAGDRDTQLLFNALSTFTTEYAKIMEGSTGSVAASSESARKTASALISASLNKGTLTATLDLMRKEMRLTIQGYGATIDHITDRMGGAPTPAAGAGPSGSVPGTGAADLVWDPTAKSFKKPGGS